MSFSSFDNLNEIYFRSSGLGFAELSLTRRHDDQDRRALLNDKSLNNQSGFLLFQPTPPKFAIFQTIDLKTNGVLNKKGIKAIEPAKAASRRFSGALKSEFLKVLSSLFQRVIFAALRLKEITR